VSVSNDTTAYIYVRTWMCSVFYRW